MSASLSQAAGVTTADPASGGAAVRAMSPIYYDA